MDEITFPVMLMYSFTQVAAEVFSNDCKNIINGNRLSQTDTWSWTDTIGFIAATPTPNLVPFDKYRPENLYKNKMIEDWGIGIARHLHLMVVGG